MMLRLHRQAGALIMPPRSISPRLVQFCGAGGELGPLLAHEPSSRHRLVAS